MATQGVIRGAVVDGPMTPDNGAAQPTTRARRRRASPVAGHADVLIAPDDGGGADGAAHADRRHARASPPASCSARACRSCCPRAAIRSSRGWPRACSRRSLSAARRARSTRSAGGAVDAPPRRAPAPPDAGLASRRRLVRASSRSGLDRCTMRGSVAAHRRPRASRLPTRSRWRALPVPRVAPSRHARHAARRPARRPRLGAWSCCRRASRSRRWPGMPPEYGLYGAMLPAIVGALWGSSWHLVSGPTNATSLMVFATVSALAAPFSPDLHRAGADANLMVGLIKLGARARAARRARQLHLDTVIVGFTAGAGILIIGAQLRNFFGLDVPQHPSFVERARRLRSRTSRDDRPRRCSSGVATLLAALAGRRFAAAHPVHADGDRRRERCVASRSRARGVAQRRDDRRAAVGDAAAVAAGVLRRRPGASSRRWRSRSTLIGLDRGDLERARRRAALRPAHRRQPGVHRPGPRRTSPARSRRAIRRRARSTAPAPTSPPARARRSPRCSRRSLLLLILLFVSRRSRRTCRSRRWRRCCSSSRGG